MHDLNFASLNYLIKYNAKFETSKVLQKKLEFVAQLDSMII